MTGHSRAFSERTLLLTLAGIQFTHSVDFMVMMPLGPQFTQLFGISDVQFGWLVSAYTLAAGASALLVSAFVDRFERKRLLLTVYAAFAVATLTCGLATTYGLLMAARIAAGLCGGVLAAMVQTIVGDAIPFERRGRAMGLVMASFSLATVAGVPASLWLAAQFGWHSTFMAIAAVSAAIAATGMRTLPRLQAHLQSTHDGRWSAITEVLRQVDHWRAFGFTAVVMGSSFIVIPFLTIFLTANVGVTPDQIPLIYLAGGVATFFSARLIGAAADRWGKVRTFRTVALIATLPVVLTTHLAQIPLGMLLVVTTAFFVFVSGRMVPGMALLASASQPRVRGTFLSLNGSVQAAAMGVASLLGGALIARDAGGLVVGYERAGWVMVGLTLVSVWAAGRLRLHASPAIPSTAAVEPQRP